MFHYAIPPERGQAASLHIAIYGRETEHISNMNKRPELGSGKGGLNAHLWASPDQSGRATYARLRA